MATPKKPAAVDEALEAHIGRKVFEPEDECTSIGDADGVWVVDPATGCITGRAS